MPQLPFKPRLTVQGWQNLVLSIMGVVVLAGAVAGAVLLNRTDDVSRELSDDIQPARVAANQLQAALRDQETGLRGYVISADRQFLDPYYDGQRDEQTAAEDIRQRVGDARRPDRRPGRDRAGRRRPGGRPMPSRSSRA